MTLIGELVIKPPARAAVPINIAKNIRLVLRMDFIKVPIMIYLSSL